MIRSNQPLRKNSRQRSAILTLLRSTKSHPGAAWIYEQLKPSIPALSQGTVYRNLALLAEQGDIQVLRSGSGMDHYDADCSLHYHVICEKCGRIDDVMLPPAQDREAEAEKMTGYRVRSHRTDFIGICPDCQSSGN